MIRLCLVNRNRRVCYAGGIFNALKSESNAYILQQASLANGMRYSNHL